MKKKKSNFLKKLFIICAIIIGIELIAMLVMKVVRERNIDHFDAINDIIKVDDGYIAVGVSDFSSSKEVDSKVYKYTDSTTKETSNIIANQSKIAKYDNDFKLVWEKTYSNLYDSTFYSVLKVDDGYVAVDTFHPTPSMLLALFLNILRNMNNVYN